MYTEYFSMVAGVSPCFLFTGFFREAAGFLCGVAVPRTVFAGVRLGAAMKNDYATLCQCLLVNSEIST